jgi:hypothetical protein
MPKPKLVFGGTYSVAMLVPNHLILQVIENTWFILGVIPSSRSNVQTIAQ